MYAGRLVNESKLSNTTNRMLELKMQNSVMCYDEGSIICLFADGVVSNDIDSSLQTFIRIFNLLTLDEIKLARSKSLPVSRTVQADVFRWLVQCTDWLARTATVCRLPSMYYNKLLYYMFNKFSSIFIYITSLRSGCLVSLSKEFDDRREITRKNLLYATVLFYW